MSKKYRCLLCRTPEEPWGHDFLSPDPQCPRCGATGPMAITPLARVHLYAPDPSNGPVVGYAGRRFRIACKPNATNPHGVPCTGDPRAVTCEECLSTRDYRTALDALQATAGGEILT